MKDAYEVLYQKEADLARIRKEIESLNIAAQLLSDDNLSFFAPASVPEEQGRKPAQKAASPDPTGIDGKPFVWPRSGFWGSLRIRR
jgi:hypothetical protein